MSFEFNALTIESNKAPPPKGWNWHTLTDLAKLESGHTPSRRRPDWWGGDVPWLALPDIRSLDGKVAYDTIEHTNDQGLANSSARLLPEGTVCLSRTASVGYVTILGRPMATSQDFVNWVCGEGLDPQFLSHLFRAARKYLRSLSSGAIHKTIYVPTVKAFNVCLPPVREQKRIAAMLNEQMAAASMAANSVEDQKADLQKLVGGLLRDSLGRGGRRVVPLGIALREVAKGVGASWSNYPVLGATRGGLAPAKEGVGKQPERYKLVDEGTIFYNPMRILLGSIAMIDASDTPGITSPDYVVLKCNPDVLHFRWFYYWLRSSYGEHFIKSLVRGAVRERMLFKRLASASIEVPSIEAQRVVAERLSLIRKASQFVEEQIELADGLPAAYLRRAFAEDL